MDEYFIKLMETPEALELVEEYPYAFWLLTLIALRARRKNSTLFDKAKDRLQAGQCFIGVGDFKKAGLTEHHYRTAKELLTAAGLCLFDGTKRGTVVTILSTRVYDWEKKDRREPSAKPPRTAPEGPTKPPQSQPELPTTNLEGKIVEREKEDVICGLDDEGYLQLKRLFKHRDETRVEKAETAWMRHGAASSTQEERDLVVWWYEQKNKIPPAEAKMLNYWTRSQFSTLLNNWNEDLASIRAREPFVRNWLRSPRESQEQSFGSAAMFANG
ncbi:MAG: hypothetical protein AAFX93_19585 [Verrucomicrobiota bacterium]